MISQNNLKQQTDIDYFSSENLKKRMIWGFISTMILVLIILLKDSTAKGYNYISSNNSNVKTTTIIISSSISSSSISNVDNAFKAINDVTKIEDTNKLRNLIEEYYRYNLRYPKSLRILDNKIFINDENSVQKNLDLISTGLQSIVTTIDECGLSSSAGWNMVYQSDGKKYDLAPCLELSKSQNLSTNPLTQF